MPECHQCYEGVLPLILMGVAYSIFAAALWPMVPIVIKDEYLGTAFGIILAIQNFGLGFGPFIVGLLQNSPDGFQPVLIFFMMVSVIGVGSGIVLYFLNIKNHNNVLQMSSQDIMRVENRRDNIYLP